MHLSTFISFIRTHFAAAFVLAVILLAVIITAVEKQHSPESPAGAQFTALGRAQASRILASYAVGYEAGAQSIDSGTAISDSIGVVIRKSDEALNTSFSRDVAPYFDRVIPAGTDETKITPEMRKTLSEAWRAYAKGLRGRK